MGVLGWSRSEFWSSTVTEFYSALEGWQEANNIEKPIPPPSPDELFDLMERYPDKK